MALAGTVVLNYDIRGVADLVSSTAISTYVTDSGANTTNNAAGLITINTTGNVKSGSYDLDDADTSIRNKDVTAEQTFSSVGAAGTNFVSVAFKLHTQLVKIYQQQQTMQFQQTFVTSIKQMAHLHTIVSTD